MWLLSPISKNMGYASCRKMDRNLAMILIGGFVVIFALAVSMVLSKNCKVLNGHRAQVNAVAFSPDGDLLASGGWDCTIILWNSSTGKEVASLDPPEGRFTEYKKGTTYDPIEGQTPPFIRSLAFSKNGKNLAVAASDRSIRLWDLVNNRQRHKIILDYADPKYKTGNDVFGVAFSPNDKLLASASFDNVVRLWAPDSGKLIREFRGHTDIVYGIAFSPDGERLASCSNDRTIRVWDVETGKVHFVFQGHQSSIRSISISPDGRYLASAAGDIHTKNSAPELILWDFKEGKELIRLDAHTGQVCSVAFSPDGTVLASGGGHQYKHISELIFWDVAQRKQLAKLNAHCRLVLAVAFSPDGKQLATAGMDKTVGLWDITKILGKPLSKLKGAADTQRSQDVGPS